MPQAKTLLQRLLLPSIFEETHANDALVDFPRQEAVPQVRNSAVFQSVILTLTSGKRQLSY